MIITCENCQTRFKVADDKLAAGPVRMRCSKCNHVFSAGAATALPDSAGTQPPTLSTLPPTTQPPQSSAQPLPGLFRAPTPAQASDPFASLPARPSTTLPFGMPAVSVAPTTQPPTTQPPTTQPPTTQPPTANDPFANVPTRVANTFGPSSSSSDPFAALGKPPPPADPFAALGKPPPPADPFAGVRVPTRDSFPGSSDGFSAPRAASAPAPFAAPEPRPSSPDPFSAPRASSDPFAPRAASSTSSPDPFSAPRASSDPFAPRAASSSPPSSPDPFSAPRASSDPFAPRAASSTSSPDPFSAPRASSDPFAPRQAASPTLPAPTFGAPPADPFATTPSRPDPFAGIAPRDATAARPDPFASLSAPAPADPFASSPPDAFGAQAEGPASQPPSAASFEGPGSDPFAGLSASANGPSAMPTLPEESDPFASVGNDVDANRAALFGFSAPEPEKATTTPPTFAATAPPTTTPPTAVAPTTPPTAAKPKPARSFAPVARVAASVVQFVLFALFVVVAVVLGRGGSLDKLFSGDVMGALASSEATADLAIEELRVTRRTVAGDGAVVVISGVVHHKGTEPMSAVKLEVHFGNEASGPPEAFGYAWSDLDALTIAALPVDGLAAVSQARPKSPTVSPGDLAPFVVVARAPAEGTPVVVVVVAEHSPAAAPTGN